MIMFGRYPFLIHGLNIELHFDVHELKAVQEEEGKFKSLSLVKLVSQSTGACHSRVDLH